MSQKRDSCTYALFQGSRKVYVGHTRNLDRSIEAHRKSGKQFSRAEKTSALITEAGARQREEQLLAAYRGGHKGKAPKYNVSVPRHSKARNADMAGGRCQPAQDRASVSASNFGPIAKAEVDLRPLTVFVGPSNTGKSWLAILLYALHKFASRERISYQLHSELCHKIGETGKADSMAGDAESLVGRVGKALRSERLVDILQRHFAKSSGNLAEEILRCYGLNDATDLVNAKAANGGKCSICIKEGHSVLMDMDLKNKIRLSPTNSSALREKISNAEQRIGSKFKGLTERGQFYRNMAEHAIELFLLDMQAQRYGVLQNRAWCLPADRTGIMHARDVVIGSLISRASLEGIRPSHQTPLLSGVLADFLEELVYVGSSRRRHRYRVPGRQQKALAKLIERRIIDGKVAISYAGATRKPNLEYQPHTWEQRGIPLMNASSMVSELAPLVIFLRYIVEEGDVLIIEEPESHLHPEKQADLVEIIAAIVNSGVRVILTTHSDWILEKLANQVLMGSQQPAGSARSKSALDEDAVGVWLFENGNGRNRKGSVVREISLGEDALYESGYREVSRQLYRDWVPLAENRRIGNAENNK